MKVMLPEKDNKYDCYKQYLLKDNKYDCGIVNLCSFDFLHTGFVFT